MRVVGPGPRRKAGSGPRRVRPAAVVLVLLAAALLSGCAAPKQPGPDRLTSKGPFAAARGDFGSKPVITFAPGVTPSPKLQREMLHRGTGPLLNKGDLIVADYLGQVWRGAVFDNSYDRGIAMTAQIGIGKLIPGWDAGLVGVPVGSRVELTVPPSDGYGPSGNAAAGIRGTDTLVFVIDIAKRYNMHSALPRTGTFEATPTSLPQVRGSLVAPPRIIFQGAMPIPARPETVVVARGAGDPLKQGTVIVQYYSVDWHDTFIASTWANGTATSVPIGNAASATGGLFDGLVGLPVGSRVLIVAPGAPGPNQASTTAVVAVDVLDQLTTAKQMQARS